MIASNSLPYFLQGAEPYPAEAAITHYVSRAKNGAAVVTIGGTNASWGLKVFTDLPPRPDADRFPKFDIFDPRFRNYFA